MWKIRNNIRFYQNRDGIPKYVKQKLKNQDSHVVRTTREKLYEYYKCDYCEEEIRILKDKSKLTGGIVVLPNSLTKRGNIKLVLCNKCLNNVLSEFEERI